MPKTFKENLLTVLDATFASVTADMMKPENIRSDVRTVTEARISLNECSEIRKMVLKAFKDKFEEAKLDIIKELEADVVDELMDKSKENRPVWRMTAEPAYVCGAERREGLLNYIQKKRGQVDEIEAEIYDLKERHASRGQI